MNFPISDSFDPDLIRANMMGLNAVKILEELSGSLSLKAGMRVLDPACDNEYAVQDCDMIKADGGRYFCIVGITAIRD